jgi:hypothetical protein
MIYKWYPTSGTHKDSKYSRNDHIDKSYKWFYDRGFFKLVSHPYSWYFYTWYHLYKTVIPQVILNFKWSSNEESFLTHKISRLSSEWPCYDIGGGAPPNGIKVKYPKWYLKSNI